MNEIREELKTIMPNGIKTVSETKTSLDATLRELHDEVAPLVESFPPAKLDIATAAKQIEETKELLKIHVNPIIGRKPEIQQIKKIQLI